MRIPKYRAWHKGHKKMYDNVTIYPDGISFNGYGAIFRFDKDGYLFELMEWTGLVDRNGKEIFEGDVFRKTYNNGHSEVTVNCKVIFGNFTCSNPYDYFATPAFY